MMIDNISDKETELYAIDFWSTLLSNIPNFIWLGLMTIFIVYSIGFLNTLENDLKLIGLIVTLFAVLKMSSVFRVVIQYKPRLDEQLNKNLVKDFREAGEVKRK